MLEPQMEIKNLDAWSWSLKFEFRLYNLAINKLKCSE